MTEDQARSDPPLRLIIADDDPLARRTVKDALQAAGITIVAEAINGREAIELARYYTPDVVLMDVIMPGIDGIEATRRLTDAGVPSKIVVLTASDDDELGLMSLKAGAVGFIHKTVELDGLPRAIRGVLDGEAAVSRRLTLTLVERFRRAHEDGRRMRPIRSVLSVREWEVLDMLSAGASTQDIAGSLVLSTETVRSHVKNILRKLGVSSRKDAVELARRWREDGAELP